MPKLRSLTPKKVIKILKHSVGFPTSFFINENDIVVDMRRGVLHPYEEEYSKSFDLNYNSFSKGLSLLLNASETSDGLAIEKL